jgi:PAS domain S-box-containing protein
LQCMKKSYLKIFFPALLAILLFILTIFIVIIPRYEQNVMNGKREMIKELTNTAISILSKYENDEKEGVLTKEEAQATAISRLQYLRYGDHNKDYFWITDTVPVMVMHPFRRDLNGKDLSTLSDPHGKLLFVEMVKTVKADEHGYVDYMWQWNDDSLHIVPKLSYVRIFKPWNWVVGTGVYIEDVKREIHALTNRLLQISFAIAVLITVLLLYVFIQSVRTEKMKDFAEDELKKSKEKYLALVEAATDGLLMIAEGRVTFANFVFSKMSGYELNELQHFPFLKMIGKNNNADVVNALSQSTIKDGKYELGLVRKNGSFFEVLITSSTTLFLGKTVNILIVKDLTSDGDISFTNVDYQKLISTLNVGFFKADFTGNGSFLFADHTAIRILGFEHFEEVANQKLTNLLTDSEQRKEIIRELNKDGVVMNKIISICNHKKQHKVISVSLVTLPDEASGGFICDGILEDITEREQKFIEVNSLVADLVSAELLHESPVHNWATTPVFMDSDKSIGTGILMLDRSKSGALVLTKGNQEIIGVVTTNDIRKRVIELKLHTDNPSYMIMSSPVVFVSEFTKVSDAVAVCREKGISHLLLLNSDHCVSGVFNLYDYLKQAYSFSKLERVAVEKAYSVEDIQEAYRKLQIQVGAFIENGLPVNFIFGKTSAFSDAVVKKLIAIAIEEMGPPPAAFAFVCMGSEGRQEETLLTDQDNALIYEDVPADREKQVSAYFAKLSEKVCVNLNTIGYAFCKGKVMAMNPQWCQPFSTWLGYFKNWITVPEPQNLLDGTIFFDFRFVCGDAGLVEQLRKNISGLISNNPSFLYHLANNMVQLKPLQLPSGSVFADKLSGFVELKSALVPIVMFARTYSLQHDLLYTNTEDRLIAMKQKGVIEDELCQEVIHAYRFLSELRIRNQARQLKGNERISNQISSKSLVTTEYYILKKIISDSEGLKNKMKSDFRISV